MLLIPLLLYCHASSWMRTSCFRSLVDRGTLPLILHELFSVPSNPKSPFCFPASLSHSVQLTIHGANQALSWKTGRELSCSGKTEAGLDQVMARLRNFIGRTILRWGHILRKPSAW